jgi:flagellar basal body rod protein FlgG
MKNSIYTTAAGMLTTAERLNVIANNLANFSTNGYKGDIPFEQTLKFFAEGPYPGKEQPILGGNVLNLQQGIIRSTGRDLDMAIEGPGFFTIKGPNNEILYTRNGAFNLNSKRELVTAEGYQVLDKSDKEITLFGQEFQFTPNGDVIIDGNYYATLKIIDSPDRKDLEKVGNNFFKLKDNTRTPDELENPSIHVGSLERSNVNLLKGLAVIADTQRTFQLQNNTADLILKILRRVVTDIPRPI